MCHVPPLVCGVCGLSCVGVCWSPTVCVSGVLVFFLCVWCVLVPPLPGVVGYVDGCGRLWLFSCVCWGAWLCVWCMCFWVCCGCVVLSFLCVVVCTPPVCVGEPVFLVGVVVMMLRVRFLLCGGAIGGLLWLCCVLCVTLVPPPLVVFVVTVLCGVLCEKMWWRGLSVGWLVVTPLSVVCWWANGWLVCVRDCGVCMCCVCGVVVVWYVMVVCL
uniref:Uncharacterized protein n=1 Tax=Knipowitschia caucasica TaxID=637954 RepID=A0AAV2KF03_KNICA